MEVGLRHGPAIGAGDHERLVLDRDDRADAVGRDQLAPPDLALRLRRHLRPDLDRGWRSGRRRAGSTASGARPGGRLRRAPRRRGGTSRGSGTRVNTRSGVCVGPRRAMRRRARRLRLGRGEPRRASTSPHPVEDRAVRPRSAARRTATSSPAPSFGRRSGVEHARQRDEHRVQATVARARGERRHARRLDLPVERAVVRRERLVVRPVSRACGVEQGDDQARDACGRLGWSPGCTRTSTAAGP